MAKKVKKTTKKKSVSTKKKAASKVKKKKVAVKSTSKTKKKTKKVAKKKVSKVPAGKKGNAKKKVKKKSSSMRKRKTTLTAAELQQYRELLLEKLHEILGDVDWIENEALRSSRLDAAGDLSSMPIHMADLGTDNYEQEFSLGLMDSERKIVRDILYALQRIEQGTYGICEGTGKPIAKARLNACPWARYGIEYANLVEQGKVIEGQPFGLDEEDYEEQELDSDMEEDKDENEDREAMAFADSYFLGEEEDEEDEEENVYY